MKEKYITPEMDILLFACEDVITTSGPIAYAANEVQFLAAGYIDQIDHTQWSDNA